MVKDRIVMPGEVLASSDELEAGNGTFEEEGLIKASRIGKLVIDNNTVIVKPLTDIPTILKVGDIVFAEVKNVKNQMVIVDVVHVLNKQFLNKQSNKQFNKRLNKHRTIAGNVTGTIHVGEISKTYVKETLTEYRVGDIIRAKIIQVNPSLQLSTKGERFGVIRAVCNNCRSLLQKNGKTLICPNCGNRERRKLAIDYGEGYLDLKED